MSKKWSDVLLSGEYEQAKFCMYNGQGYCCLGVLEHACGVSFIPSFGRYTDEYGSTTLPSLEFIYHFGVDINLPITQDEYDALAVVLDEVRGVDSRKILQDIDINGYLESSRMAVLSVLNDNGLDFAFIALVLRRLGWDEEVPKA